MSRSTGGFLTGAARKAWTAWREGRLQWSPSQWRGQLTGYYNRYYYGETAPIVFSPTAAAPPPAPAAAGSDHLAERFRPALAALSAGRTSGPQHVLFVSHDAWRTGAPILFLRWLRWFKANGDVPFSILLREGVGELRGEFERLAPTLAWNELRDMAAAGVPEPMREFVSYVHEHVGLIYSNTITNGEVLEALAGAERPVITHVHELDYWIQHRLSPVNVEQNRRYSTHFVAVSNAVKDNLVRHVGIDAARIDVIHGFVAPDAHPRSVDVGVRARLAIPPDAVIVGGSGTTDWRKAPDLFVQLAAAVRRQNPGVTVPFLWVGGQSAGPNVAALRHDAVRSGVGDRVHFVGQQEYPLPYFAAMDVFALVSREDPFPLVCLEAASLGKPTVCFDASGGMKEFVEEDAGIVVPYLDIESMAAAVLRLRQSPDLRSRLGDRAAVKVRQSHHVDVIGPRLLAIVRRFLTGSAPARRMTSAEIATPASAGTSAEPASARQAAPPTASAPRVVAFYLPQFHPIPENDAWWGPGFTEWTNVAAARPLFDGHLQPDLPADLGFYDLRVPEVREAQAELARSHGIHGFCYYHYWFNGRQLLERPFNEVLASGRPDFPFCLCWANENWTRAWDGHERDVLLAQRHSPEDDRRHMQWLAPAMRDPRYIRVDDKPLLLVYRISLLPDPAQTAAVWREEAHELGLGDILLATVESLRADRVDPAAIGFDAAVEFQPDWLNLGTPLYSVGDGNQVYSYATLMERALARSPATYRRFPCVTTGWDNTPRRRQNAAVFVHSSPDLYERWLERAIDGLSGTADSPLVFVNAWNEWAEGAHLEPGQQRGLGYLEATKRAIAAGRRALPQALPHTGDPANAAANAGVKV